MQTITVNVAHRGTAYCRQIVAGFEMLSQQGMLQVHFNETPELKNRTNHEIEILVDGKRIVCDLSDGYNNFTSFESFDLLLDDVDFFFKACNKQEYNVCLRNAGKVHTLAPRYAATIPGSWNEKFALTQLKKTGLTSFAKEMLWHIPGTKHAISDYYYDRFEKEAAIDNSEPKVFFYTRLWDPSIASPASSQNMDLDGKTVEERIKTKNQEYLELSQLRAELVRGLKREFKSRFVGGIAPEPYTIKNYPDLLGEDLSKRRVYTKAMHSAEICVNTWGTHKCFNFSFGEELAASRAIVTQKPFYDIPDYLNENENFLSYSTIDECIQQVAVLFDDKTKIEEMMEKNRAYYLSYLRPDKYVLDILNEAGV